MIWEHISLRMHFTFSDATEEHSCDAKQSIPGDQCMSQCHDKGEADESVESTCSDEENYAGHQQDDTKETSSTRICNCKSDCTNKKCRCLKYGLPCTDHCHNGMKCKNKAGKQYRCDDNVKDELPDWEGFDQYLEDMWSEEKPVIISQEVEDIIASESFSAKPIRPIGAHIPDGFSQVIPQSFASSYVVNSHEDAAKLQKVLSDHKQPQPSILVYPYETIANGDSVIKKLLMDHFGHRFNFESYAFDSNSTGGTQEGNDRTAAKVPRCSFDQRNEAAFHLVKSLNAMKKKIVPNENSIHPPIAVDDLPNEITANVTTWIEKFNLLTSDKEVLQSPTHWLNSSIIDVSQRLLAEQFQYLDGFQSVGCSYTMSFAVHDKFIQILHDSVKNHWLTISTIETKEPNVFVYDSLYRQLSENVQHQIACIMKTQFRQINVHFADIQRKSGTSDCGLFSIAFATSLCFGKQPELIFYNQPLMRQHLIKCFEVGRIEEFPIAHTRRLKATKVTNTQSIKVYCFC
ncbi:uncharacterized protein [Dysidea avara]|uniref:uncharacterized protein isoform X1 n=1 Tax=Dysidea avara TaxID=196820 RepID=UPI00331CDBA1